MLAYTMGDVRVGCDVYFNFVDKIKTILTRSSANNQATMSEVGPGEARMGLEPEVTKVRFIDMMVAWERYIWDLFEKAFELLICICSGHERKLKYLGERWPGCRVIIEKEIANRAPNKHQVETVAYDLLEKAEQQTNPEGQKEWIQLLHDHRKRLYKKTLQPIFNYTKKIHDHRGITIDSLFMQLFQHTGQTISEILVEVAGSNYFLLYPDELQVTLQAVDSSNAQQPTDAVEALHNISRLYYGLRCIFAHGSAEGTFEAALRGFPDSKNFPLPTQKDEVKKVRVYTSFFKSLQDHKAEVKVSELALHNFSSFILFAAKHLMHALGKWIYSLQCSDSPVWGYPPSAPPPSN